MKYKWLLFAFGALVFYGILGLMTNYSTYQHPFSSNLIIQATAAIVAVTVSSILYLSRNEKIKFSFYGVLSGFGCIGTYFILNALSKNGLVVAYPFAAMSGLVFFIITYVTMKPKYTNKQIYIIFGGLALGLSGLFLANAASVGGLSEFVKDAKVNSSLILNGLGVMIFWGLSPYFLYKAVGARNNGTGSIMVSVFLSSLIITSILALIFNPSSFNVSFERNIIFPIIAGISIPVAYLFLKTAYKNANAKSVLQNLIIAILANAEIIPVTLFAMIFLGEFSVTGIFAVLSSVFGLVLLNYADKIKV